LHNQLRRLS